MDVLSLLYLAGSNRYGDMSFIVYWEHNISIIYVLRLWL